MAVVTTCSFGDVNTTSTLVASATSEAARDRELDAEGGKQQPRGNEGAERSADEVPGIEAGDLSTEVRVRWHDTGRHRQHRPQAQRRRQHQQRRGHELNQEQRGIAPFNRPVEPVQIDEHERQALGDEQAGETGARRADEQPRQGQPGSGSASATEEERGEGRARGWHCSQRCRETPLYASRGRLRAIRSRLPDGRSSSVRMDETHSTSSSRTTGRRWRFSTG